MVKKSFSLALTSVLSLFLLYGCSDSGYIEKATIEYTSPNLTKEGVMYDIEIEQNLEGSVIKSSGRIRFSPKCEYFLNINAYTNPGDEFMFTLTKSSNSTAFIKAKAPGSDMFTPWSDYRDPATPGAIVMFYPAMVMNGDPDGYLCSIDKIYNFMEKNSDNSYSWSLGFLEEYTMAAAASWRDMIADASGLEGSSKDKLRKNLESILVPNSTFALQSFPTAYITEEAGGYTVVFDNKLENLSMVITLKESESAAEVDTVNATDFPSRLSLELSGLTDAQILSQFPDNTPKNNNN